MLIYASIRDNGRELLALTGLTASEFGLLLGPFERAYARQHPPERTAEGRRRVRAAGGGRRAVLAGGEDRLLFILVYVKTYPIQSVLGRLFGMSQPSANHWVHRLLPALNEALAEAGAAPERDPARFARTGRPAGPNPDRRLIVDGTDRRRQRPKNPADQALYYSGKRKAHCDRNVLVSGVKRGRVKYLSKTYPRRAHEKAIPEHEGLAYPPDAELYMDGGFAGYDPPGTRARRPKKKGPAGRSRPASAAATAPCRASASASSMRSRA